MMRLEPLEDGDFAVIAAWNEGKPRDFVVQWAGPGFPFPVTEERLKAEFSERNTPEAGLYYYKILLDGRMIGTIQFFKFDRAAGTAVVGRFLIGEEGDRGRGYGGQALRQAVRLGFDKFGLKAVILGVFDFNKNAIRCYEKVGFAAYEFSADAYQSANGPWGLYRMKITPDAIKG